MSNGMSNGMSHAIASATFKPAASFPRLAIDATLAAAAAVALSGMAARWGFGVELGLAASALAAVAGGAFGFIAARRG